IFIGRDRYSAAGWIRFVMSGDGARSHTPGARAGVREIREFEVRGEAQSDGGAFVRTQCALHVHGRRRPADYFPERIIPKSFADSVFRSTTSYPQSRIVSFAPAARPSLRLEAHHPRPAD